jgi:hypothetical protein
MRQFSTILLILYAFLIQYPLLMWNFCPSSFLYRCLMFPICYHHFSWNIAQVDVKNNKTFSTEMAVWVHSHPFLVDLLSSLGVRRLSFVVCKLFTFQASSPKPLGQLEPNLAGLFLGWSSTKFLFFVPVGYSTWLPGPIICSDWLKFQRSSSLKLLNWLNPNCKWMIIGMSFTKFLLVMPIGNPGWPPPQDID